MGLVGLGFGGLLNVVQCGQNFWLGFGGLLKVVQCGQNFGWILVGC